jgi:uncharacterized protein YodC (DUF2158 family)
MTNAIATFADDTGFRRGHRVRFANGPVMTVMNYTEGEFGETLIVCGWWRNSLEIDVVEFHPDVLIHTEAEYSSESNEPAAENPDEFDEFHSG